MGRQYIILAVIFVIAIVMSLFVIEEKDDRHALHTFAPERFQAGYQPPEQESHMHHLIRLHLGEDEVEKFKNSRRENRPDALGASVTTANVPTSSTQATATSTSTTTANATNAVPIAANGQAIIPESQLHRLGEPPQSKVVEQVVYHVLVIDIDRSGLTGPSSVILGKDPILMIARKGSLQSGEAIGNQANEHLFIFNDLNSLAQLDKDKNFAFEKGDGVFSHLLFGFYNPVHRLLTYHHMEYHNVSSVVMNKYYLAKDYADDLSRLNESAGYVVINGAHYPIYVVAVKKSLFDRMHVAPHQGLFDSSPQ